MEIFLILNQKQAGPYTLDVTNGYLEQRHISGNTLAWHQGLDGWKPVREVAGVSASNDLEHPRNIYFSDGDIMVDIANKELCIRGRWFRRHQVHHWEAVSHGPLRIYIDDLQLPLYEYRGMWAAKHQQLIQALKICGLT